jgi:hypothetical protein
VNQIHTAITVMQGFHCDTWVMRSRVSVVGNLGRGSVGATHSMYIAESVSSLKSHLSSILYIRVLFVSAINLTQIQLRRAANLLSADVVAPVVRMTCTATLSLWSIWTESQRRCRCSASRNLSALDIDDSNTKRALLNLSFVSKSVGHFAAASVTFKLNQS